MTDFDLRRIGIITPEHVSLQFETAGIGSRGLALLLDLLLLMTANLILIAAAGFVFGFDRLGGTSSYVLAAVILLLFASNFGYFIILEYFWSGKSVGKSVMHLRVIQQNGQALTFLSAVVRNLFRLLDGLPFNYFVGAAVSFFHPQDKRIGDLVAGTVVIAERTDGRKRAGHRLRRAIRTHRRPLPADFWEQAKLRELDYEDWLIVSRFIERLPDLTRRKRAELGMLAAQRLAGRLDIDEQAFRTKVEAVAFLIALYEQIREDWESGL